MKCDETRGGRVNGEVDRMWKMLPKNGILEQYGEKYLVSVYIFLRKIAEELNENEYSVKHIRCNTARVRERERMLFPCIHASIQLRL